METRDVADESMHCSEYAEDWSAWLDGELAPEREAGLRAHLAGCARCRREVEALRAVDARLAAVPARPLPADLQARLRARIEAEGGAERAPAAAGAQARLAARPAPRRSRRWLARPAVALATAVAAAVALYLVVGREPPAGPAQPELQVAQQQPTPPVAPEPPAPQEVHPSPAPQGGHHPPPPAAAEGDADIDAIVAQVLDEAPAPDSPALDQASDDELAVGLDLDTIEDLDVIANLDVLEALVSAQEGAG